MPWTCFWLDPSPYELRALRRYTGYKSGARECEASGLGYHNAKTVINPRARWRGKERAVNSGPMPPLTDRRWPKRCACGYRFTAKDAKQFWSERLYKRSDTGDLTTLSNAPIGAMWNASWMLDYGPSPRKRGTPYCGPDGMCLVVKTPGGDWMIDGYAHPKGATEGVWPAWTRTGTPPAITVSPSISIGDPERYHGFLQNGALTDDLAGKTYG